MSPPSPGTPAPERDELIERLVEQVATEQARLVRVFDRLPGLVGTASPLAPRAGAAEIARDVCDAPVALFIAQDDDGDEATVAAPGVTHLELPAARQAPLLSAAFDSDELLVIDDVTRAATGPATRLYGTIDGGRLLRSWLAVPVRHRGGPASPGGPGLVEDQRAGVLLVGHTRPHAFDARHHRLLTAVARQLAAALEGAQLVSEHQRVVAGLQETLLPPLLPKVDRADVASRYRPAGDTSLIGGDFYDVFPAPDGRWVAVIGDVCGVGPEAAAVTGIARYTLRAVGRDHRQPARALAALNEAILSRTVDNRFCTAIAAHLEPSCGGGLQVTWSNGGHPPPLVLRDDGRVELLDACLGPLLGVLASTEFKDAAVQLNGGDALVLYTDGVIEARPRGGDFFGERRLAELVASCAGRTADGIARRIELAVLDHLGGLPDDDVAILVIRATHPPGA